MTGDYGPPDLPGIEELTGPEPERERDPGWLDVQLRHLAGLGETPLLGPDQPDVSGLAEDLGLALY